MAIKHLDAQALRDYVRSHHENTFALVDVRQPEEYRNAHIPGAKLLPLPDLVQGMDQLPNDKELIFYCHSGGRSMSAAIMAEETGLNGPIYNLYGGMLSWDGDRVADFPMVNLFRGKTPAEMFQTAMNLEKGAQIFYETIGHQNAEHEWAQIFTTLSKAEIAHARTVYGHWQKIENQQGEFEATYEALSGEVLEGGMPLKEAIKKIAAPQENPRIRLIELALQIENTAFDLYRTLSDQVQDQESQSAFTHLAQAEKAHMESLIRQIGNSSIR